MIQLLFSILHYRRPRINYISYDIVYDVPTNNPLALAATEKKTTHNIKKNEHQFSFIQQNDVAHSALYRVVKIVPVHTIDCPYVVYSAFKYYVWVCVFFILKCN